MLEEAEIAALYERYGHAIFRRAQTLLGNDDDAREILQETFCQFVKGRSFFAWRSSVFTYLYRIATNLSIDVLRRRSRRGSHVSLDEHITPEAGENMTKRSVQLGELAHLVDGLDPEVVTVAVMVHVDGQTQDEVAAALRLSRRTVGKRLQRFLEYTRLRAGVEPTAPALAREVHDEV